jgi:polysaccharide export outer membrane protein
MKQTFLLLALTSLLFAAAPDPGAAQAAGAVPAAPVPGAAGGVQPGDQVGVRIVREPELSGVFTVSDRGEVVLPRLGVVHVAGREAGAIRDSLRAGYGRYLRDPAIEVTVLRRVGVHGEVMKPGLYMVDLTVTLRDVIAQAGGITPAGNDSKIEIVRGDTRQRVPADESGEFLAAELRSGDQVIVGRRSWMALNPNVAVTTATGLVGFLIGLYQLIR